MTPTDMQGTICLVTGSTSGLGKATAFALAQQHATVILGCRDRQRGEAVLAEIKAASPAASAELLLLDLSVQNSIRSAVAEMPEAWLRKLALKITEQAPEAAAKKKADTMISAFLDDMPVYKIHAFSEGRFTEQRLEEILSRVQ